VKDSQNSSVVKWIVLAVALLVVVAIFFSMGRGYGKVSDRSYKYATALYSACLSESGERLEKISELIEKDTIEELIPSHELKWLTAIVEQAQNGDWKSAAQSSKRMMEDQVEY
jgi:hypothetical protein